MKTYRISGVIRGTSNVAYAFDLPKTENEETASYLQFLADRFLSFLQKESEKPCDVVRFGGIRFEEEDNRLTLFAAVCPFEKREYFPKATLFLDENENIVKVQKEKRSR